MLFFMARGALSQETKQEDLQIDFGFDGTPIEYVLEMDAVEVCRIPAGAIVDPANKTFTCTFAAMPGNKVFTLFAQYQDYESPRSAGYPFSLPGHVPTIYNIEIAISGTITVTPQ